MLVSSAIHNFYQLIVNARIITEENDELFHGYYASMHHIAIFSSFGTFSNCRAVLSIE